MHRDSHHSMVLLPQNNILRHLTSVPPARIRQTVAWHHQGVFFSSTEEILFASPSWGIGSHLQRRIKGGPPQLQRETVWDYTQTSPAGCIKNLMKNGLMQDCFQVKLRLLTSRRDWGKKEKKNLISLHIKFSAFSMIWSDRHISTSSLFACSVL